MAKQEEIKPVFDFANAVDEFRQHRKQAGKLRVRQEDAERFVKDIALMCRRVKCDLKQEGDVIFAEITWQLHDVRRTWLIKHGYLEA